MSKDYKQPILLTKIILLLIIALFSFEAHAVPKTPEEFSQWMMFYYLKPEPASVTPAMKYAISAHLLDDLKKSGPPVFGFIAGIVKNNPALAGKLVTEFDSIDENQYSLFLIGIWYADLPNYQSQKLVSAALARHPALKKPYPFLQQPPVDLLTVPAKNGPWVLDALWGNFMATGDSRPVINIISVLPWIDVSKKNEVLAMGKPGLYLVATGGAANWSLTSNAKQHKRVLEICESQISKQPEPIATQLRTIVHKAKLQK